MAAVTGIEDLPIITAEATRRGEVDCESFETSLACERSGRCMVSQMECSKLLIATPTYGGQVTSEYLLSIRNLERALAAKNIESDLSLIDGTIIHHVRNTFINMLLQRKEYSHLLFVDSDMVFHPAAVERLLDFGVPLAGCLYPAKRFDLEAFYANAKKASSAAEAMAQSQPYVGFDDLQWQKAGDRHGYRYEKGFIRTDQIGCGVMLIHRSVIETMTRRSAGIKLELRCEEYSTLLGDVDVYLAFEPMTAGNGRPLSEDMAFCHRWRHDCGGEVWALVDEPVGHIGRTVFSGRPLDFIVSNPPPTRPKQG